MHTGQTIIALTQLVDSHLCRQTPDCSHLGQLCVRCAERGEEKYVCSQHSEKCLDCGAVNCLECSVMHITFCDKAPSLDEEWQTG